MNHIREQLKLTPLEILANAVEQYGISNAVGERLFRSYAEFLQILDDKTSRESLEKLQSKDAATDVLFKRVREIGKAYELALDHIFFENSRVSPLTRKYGLF